MRAQSPPFGSYQENVEELFFIGQRGALRIDSSRRRPGSRC